MTGHIANTPRPVSSAGWSRWYGWGWCEWRACQTAVQAAGEAARPLCSSLYSSRVSERADRRVLLALEARCLSGAPALRLPSSATLQDYACSLESLPCSDSATLLQLPLNCRSARLQRYATLVMDGLREFNSTARVKEEGSFTTSKMLQSLWKKLMAGSPLLKPDYRVTDCVGWWGAVVSAEARDAARGARVLHASLSAGRFLSPMTQVLTLQLYIRPYDPFPPIVPESWQLVWPGPDLPQDYLREFTSRARAAHQRTAEEAPSQQDYMPTELDLRLFFRPDRVLSALLALRATRLACPPATLVLTAQWNCTDGNADSGGLSVKGLSLSGGVWSSSDEGGRERRGEGSVASVSAESPTLSDAPPILLRYVCRAEDSSQGSRDSQPALIPLYESPRRETELCWLRAPLGPSLTAQDAALHALALVVTPHD
ncbi:putative Cytoplasmic dynein 2 heavy chain 1 [Danaus plexippus plexippus]|uniref:Cytoplasmic dynein 2 heavy chain 1 n=1 Tax=Danaus plexippus plexippus TaxID=278856 RepID=A0A212EMB0_DANPL|nr:putative Cytoplasmic dynein 2 heavy chain 1 [Danaus plexippus plexippus]